MTSNVEQLRVRRERLIILLTRDGKSVIEKYLHSRLTTEGSRREGVRTRRGRDNWRGVSIVRGSDPDKHRERRVDTVNRIQEPIKYHRSSLGSQPLCRLRSVSVSVTTTLSE